MASVTDICNRALQKLGAARITDVTEQSVNARACAACYVMLRQALLRAHPWNFAIKRYQLAADSSAPAFGPTNRFPLPTGWLKVLDPDPSENFGSRDWTIEDGAIMTDEDAPLNVRCVIDVTDTSKFDPLFSEALASYMAEEMAEQLTQSNTKKDKATALKKEAIREAKKANAIEKVPQVSPDGSWITARTGGTFWSPGSGSWG